ncbi:phage major tail protein, TP901-1 family [Paucilactobacillus sp. N302-9]
MADTTTAAYQGIDKVIYARKHNDGTPVRVPFQTTHNLDLSRDNDSTATKDGAVPSIAPLEGELEVEALSSNSPAYALFEDSLNNNERLDIWEVNFAETNEEGLYEATYLEAVVNEISVDNDADDLSASDVTFSVYPTPVKGFTAVSKEEVDEVAYAFQTMDPKA